MTYKIKDKEKGIVTETTTHERDIKREDLVHNIDLEERAIANHTVVKERLIAQLKEIDKILKPKEEVVE